MAVRRGLSTRSTPESFHFHKTSFRKLLSIKWQEKIPDTEVLIRAGTPSIYTMLIQSQLRWAGHVVRMPDHRLPRNYSLANYRKESVPGVHQRSLKTFLKAFSINPDSWEVSMHKTGVGGKPQSMRAPIAVKPTEQRRQARKDSAKDPAAATIHCFHCSRLQVFRARIGPTSHLRTHRPGQPHPP
ncbi:uncharacterized protein [Magallana gigas]|uniref:uncharacterized protein n=1 Tax=Magallana gigas TaxID=29159 RepID=UPI003342C569